MLFMANKPLVPSVHSHTRIPVYMPNRIYVMDEAGVNAANVPVFLHTLAPTVSCVLVAKCAYREHAMSPDQTECVQSVS